MDTNVVETFKTIRKIYDGFERNKKLDDVFYKEDFIKKYEMFLTPFLNYERKFLVFLALCTIVVYGKSNFIDFLKRMNHILKNREIYYNFKNILKNPKYFVQKDVNYILENYSYISKDDIFYLYNSKKISFYTFYFLAKRYVNELNVVEKMIFERVDYLFKYIKYKIDESIFSIVVSKQYASIF